MSRRPGLVVALDLPDADAAVAAARRLEGQVDLFKVGLELFVAAGPAVVHALTGAGARVFLDLKLHDIPATVAGAVRGLADLGVEMVTLHASGGRRMLEAAAGARWGSLPLLLGVTVLTSLDADELARLGLDGEPAGVVSRWAAVAREGGCDGVVASAAEARLVREEHGHELIVVTPGIRPAGAGRDDQARVATPADAVAAGADYLVVGRPILNAPDPAAAAAAIRAEMEDARGAS